MKPINLKMGKKVSFACLSVHCGAKFTIINDGETDVVLDFVSCPVCNSRNLKQKKYRVARKGRNATGQS